MSRDPLPEPWRSELEKKGVISRRGLAEKAAISPQTAVRLVDGVGQPSAETVAKVADAFFGGDRTHVWKLAGFSRRDHGEWGLPPEASLLDEDQRAAVLAVVRAMLPDEVRKQGDGDEAAPMRQAGSGRALRQETKAERDLRKAEGLLERMTTSECHVERLEPESPTYRYLT